MRISLTELYARTAEVLRPVRAGESVVVTDHGHEVAVICPVPAREMSGAELADRMKDHDPEALRELAKNLANSAKVRANGGSV